MERLALAAAQHARPRRGRRGALHAGDVVVACTQEARLFGDGWHHPGVALLILAAALRFRLSGPERRWAAVAGVTLAGVLAGYFAVYLVTPANLDWHLSTSLGRLLVQVWPSALLLAFIMFRPLEEAARQTNRRETGRPARFKTNKRRDFTGG